jgi:outer membrane protein assembly factor BamB
MLYQRGKLYQFATTPRVVRINPSDGTIIFNVTASMLGLQHAPLAAVGSDFLMLGQNAATGHNLYCMNESDGSIRWRDYWLGIRAVIVSDDDRIWVCGIRSDQ